MISSVTLTGDAMTDNETTQSDKFYSNNNSFKVVHASGITSQNQEVGVCNQECEPILDKISQNHIEHLSPIVGKEMVKLDYDLKKTLDVEIFRNPYVLEPKDYETLQDFFTALEHWWIFRYRKNPSTIKDRIRYAKNMSKHPVYPIDWLKLNPNQVIAYLEHREYQDYGNTRGKHQIRNDWKTIKTIAKAFGIDAELWGYIPPCPPKAKVRKIPSPDEVHAIIHHKYCKDKYTKTLYQYILMHGFSIGWRPAELVIQKVSDVHYEDGYLIITETKKGDQMRQIFPEKRILSGERCKSFKNYIEDWRPKVLNQYSGDFLYLQANGRPFTVNYLRKLLTPEVKKVWSSFSLYTMRHWCAIARLIQGFIDNGTWDKTDVQDWLGHERVSTTDDYTKYAKKYYLIAKFDWIKSILKFHTKKCERGKWKKFDKLAKKGFIKPVNRRKKECSHRDSNPSLRLERAK